jgi:protein-S-isoprenylcysteine O-methyltransferase Ste14
MIFFDIVIILLLYASFGAVHSLLAALSVKERVAVRFPRFMPYYRLSYNLFSLFHFYWVYELTPFIDVRVYDLPNPYDILILIPQFASLLGFVWSVAYFNGAEFLGIAQIGRRKNYKTASLDEEATLTMSGPYKFSRHPVYFFSIGILLFRPYMFLDYLVSLLCIIAYFYIGAYYEEKRLQKKFGEAYRRYIAATPMIVPLPRFRRSS